MRVEVDDRHWSVNLVECAQDGQNYRVVSAEAGRVQMSLPVHSAEVTRSSVTSLYEDAPCHPSRISV